MTIANKKSFYTISIICFVIMIGFSFIPPIGDITPTGMRALGIFLGCMVGWITGYIITTSLMGLTIYALYMPGESFSTMLSGMFGNVDMLMVVTSLLFAYAIQKSGLMDYVAQKLLSAKITTKSPWHLSVMMWLTTMLCTIFVVNSFAVIILMFALYYDIADQLGLKKQSPYVAFTLIGMAILASIAVGVAPYSSAVLVCIAIMSNLAPDVTYSIPEISGVNFCLVFCVFLIICVVSKILFKGKMNPHIDVSNIKAQNREVPLTPQIVISIFSIIALLIILLLPTFLPNENFLNVFLSRIGGAGCFMFISVILAFIVFKNEPMFDLEDAMTHGCRWEVVFLLGTALYLSKYLISEESGVLSTLTVALNNSIGGFGVYTAALIILFIALIFTNIASNGAAMQLFTPIFTVVLLSYGINPAVAIGLLTVVVDHGLIFPSGSVIGAFLHANKEWLTSSQVFKYTTFGATSLLIAVAVFGLPIALAFA